MKKSLIIGLLLVIILLGAAVLWKGCKHTDSIPADKLTKKALIFWGVWDDSEDWQAIIDDFHSEYSNITIEYRKLKPEEYENALLEAWAAGEGPDIFMVHNSWIHGYQKFLAPMPVSIKMANFSISKNLFGREQTTVSLQTVKFPDVNEVVRNFVDVVADDVIIDSKTYGLPPSVDTLALYYNKDLLANENIFLPPTIWDEFANQMVPKLTKQDEQGNIIQAGTALGTSQNIDRAIDILSLLMMQNGTLMIDNNNANVAFANAVNKEVLGKKALDFYTDFASPAKVAYTWNDSMPSALEVFVQGQLAFMFGYSYSLNGIQQRGTRLNFDVAPMLHINPDGTDNNPSGLGRKTINYANYWVLGAYKESEYMEEAWNFIRFATTQKDKSNKYEVIKYLEKTNKPGALRDVLNAQKNDPGLSVFANQALSAQSWYTGYDAEAMEQYFEDMIDNVVSGKSSSLEAIGTAADQVKKTLNTK